MRRQIGELAEIWRFVNAESPFSNMARKAVAKTPFAQRLTAIRESIGYKERAPFAEFLQIKPDTLGGYERGDSSPDYAFLEMYKRRFGVNLNWLITGEGEMFTHSLKAGSPSSRDQDLKRIEERLSAFDKFPIQIEQMPEGAAALYDELNSIVASEKDDRARAVADMMLRLAFDDDKANQRTKIRTGAFSKALREASKRLEVAVKKAEWQPPIGINENLKALTFGYGISEDDLAELLSAIHFALKDK